MTFKFVICVGMGLLFLNSCALQPTSELDRLPANQKTKITDSAICPSAEIKAVADLNDKVVTVCSKLYSERPFVHLPATRPGAFVGSIIPSTDVHFIDQQGKDYVLLNSKGKPLSFATMSLDGKVASHIYLYTVYQISGKSGTYVDPDLGMIPSITLTSIEPLIFITGEAIDQLFIGTWEGLITPRLVPQPNANGSPDAFHVFDQSEKNRIVVRIEFSKLKKAALNFTKWDDSKVRLKTATVSEASGTIQNYKAAVKSSDGKCIPSLASLDQANPFLGSKSDAVTAYRWGAMHTATDQVVVFVYPKGAKNLTENGMDGSQHFFHPAALFQMNPEDIWKHIKVNPHGIPNGFTIEHLRRVESGGEGC